MVEGLVVILLLNQLSHSFYFMERFHLKNARVGQVLGIPRFISHADLCSTPLVWFSFCLKIRFTFDLQLEVTKIGYEDAVALYGLTNFIPKSSLNRSGTSNVKFFMNGFLYFRVKVSVDSQNRKPWLECKSGCTRLITSS